MPLGIQSSLSDAQATFDSLYPALSKSAWRARADGTPYSITPFANWLKTNDPPLYQRYFALTMQTQIKPAAPPTPPAPAPMSPEEQRFAAARKTFVMPPLEDLEYSTLTVIRTTIGRDVDDPPWEKREMRRELAARLRAIKLYALGLGPAPPGGMPKSGPTLYWNRELETKVFLFGRNSLTPAEVAKRAELSNQARAMLSKRARDKRKRKIKKIAAVAAITIGAVYLGAHVAGALKGAGAASTTAGAGAGSAASILQPVAVTATKLTTAAAATAAATTVVTPAMTAAALAAKAGTVLSVASSTLSSKAAEVIPKVVKLANNARTIKAIADGEVPPPPITLEGSNFTEYAQSLGSQLLQKEIADKREELTTAQMAADKRMMDDEIRRLQMAAGAYIPAGTPQYPVQQLTPQAQSQLREEHRDTDWIKMAALAVPLLFVMRG